MKKSFKKNKNIFIFASLVLCILNAICNIVSMFKGNNYHYLFDLKLGEACVTIMSSTFILLSAAMMILNFITKKKDYLYITLILYIFTVLLQIPVFKLDYSLFISIGLLVLLIIGIIKEK